MDCGPALTSSACSLAIVRGLPARHPLRRIGTVSRNMPQLSDHRADRPALLQASITRDRIADAFQCLPP